MDLPQRKLQRLQNYNYSQNGAYFITKCTHNRAYFITTCTHNREHLFGRIDNDKIILNNAGRMVFEKFSEISEFYPDIVIDKFIVLPNHLHAILLIQHTGTPQGAFPTMDLSDYIHRFKTLTTRLYLDGVRNSDYISFDKKVWQKSYHDHIIRNNAEYQKIWEYIDTNLFKWEYIDTNPFKWHDDCYYEKTLIEPERHGGRSLQNLMLI